MSPRTTLHRLLLGLAGTTLSALAVALGIACAGWTARGPGDAHWRLVALGGSAVRLELEHGEGNVMRSWGSTLPLEALRLSAERLSGPEGPIRLELHRDAGTLLLRGRIGRGRGRGDVQFRADPEFAAALVQRGYPAPSTAEHFQLALAGVGVPLVDALAEHGYPRPTVAGLVELARRGVDVGWLRSVESTGHKPRTVGQLIATGGPAGKD